MHLLPRRSVVARVSCCCVFSYRGHARFWNFYSTIPVDVVRVKSYMNCFFDSARVVIRVTINKLYLVPEWLVSGVVSMLWNWSLQDVAWLTDSFRRLRFSLAVHSGVLELLSCAFAGWPPFDPVWCERLPVFVVNTCMCRLSLRGAPLSRLPFAKEHSFGHPDVVHARDIAGPAKISM